MITLQKYLSTLLLLLASNTGLAQEKGQVACTTGNGPTNVWQDKSKDASIVTKLNTGDFFYCTPAGGDWYKIEATKRAGSIHMASGYVQQSHIQLLSVLNTATQRTLIRNIFLEEKVLNPAADEPTETEQATLSRNYEKRREYHDSKFDIILNFFPVYFCKTGDTNLLHLLLQVICTENGSADEKFNLAIGDCYECQPDTVLQQVAMLPKDQQQLMYTAIEWGLQNHFHTTADEVNEPASPEYRTFKKRLDIARKKSFSNKN